MEKGRFDRSDKALKEDPVDCRKKSEKGKATAGFGMELDEGLLEGVSGSESAVRSDSSYGLNALPDKQ